MEKNLWVITGCAGFIGSHLLERMLAEGSEVIGIDDFSNGSEANLDAVRKGVGEPAWQGFRLMRGDIRDATLCAEALKEARGVFHHAALASVPESVREPERYASVNEEGTRVLLRAARDAGAKRFVYASSSAVYGDDPHQPKVESRIGKPLSPYAANKRMNEIDAARFHEESGMETIGFRYFNIFGPRQDPLGPYAAVISRWLDLLTAGQPLTIFGDGSATRDFCPVWNVVDALSLAAKTKEKAAFGQVFNIGTGHSVNLKQLGGMMIEEFRTRGKTVEREIRYAPARPGDILHSSANIEFARRVLGYEPKVDLFTGLRRLMDSLGV